MTLFWVKDLAQTKIYDLQVARFFQINELLREHDVFRLQIPVDYICGMAMIDCRE